MWSRAQINKTSAFVRSDFTAIWDLSRDQGNLEWVAAEKSESLFFGQDKTREGLRRGNDFSCSFLDILVVFFVEYIRSCVRIVEESVFGWWTVTKLHSVFVLESLAQNVSRRMPEGLFTLFIFEFNQTKITVSFKRSADIPEIPLIILRYTCLSLWIQKPLIQGLFSLTVLDFSDNNCFGQVRRNSFCNRKWGAFVASTLFDGSVW